MERSAQQLENLFGTARPESDCRMLSAGPLEVRFENGNLRYVRYEGVEVLRAISYVIRDRDWGTLAVNIADLDIRETADEFEVCYSATCQNNGSVLALNAKISGASDGRLSFVVDAVPDRDFETNRCGFNVLHPIDGVAGSSVGVEHCNGKIMETNFPDLIEPWQPFKSIRALTHKPSDRLIATCRMTGDEFEMEDQRNWSDASFKTYVRPIELPWPYVMSGGETCRQSIELSIIGEDANSDKTPKMTVKPRSDAPVHIELAEVSGKKFPKIGLVVTPEEITATIASLGLLSDVAPQTLLCHFDPTVGHDKESLRAFGKLQSRFGAIYELEYVVAGDGNLEQEFQQLRDGLSRAFFCPDKLLVCPSVDRQSTPPGSTWPECPPLSDIYNAALTVFPDITLGGGMFSYFTELNRKRPPVEMLDFVTHATNPIVHAADDESVMETLETLPHIFRSARAIIGANKEYCLGPTTIAMRQNPYGSRTFPNPDGERICMAHDDPRHRGVFGAAWTIGYGMRVSDADVSRWVPTGIVGPRGIIDESGEGLWPVGLVVRDMCAMAGRPIITCRIDAPHTVAAIGVQEGEIIRMLIANLTGHRMNISVGCLGLVEELGAYGFMRLDVPASKVLN